MLHKDICIGQMRIFFYTFWMSPLASLYFSLRTFSGEGWTTKSGVWSGAEPQRNLFSFFSGILSYFIKPFFTKNWSGCGTLLLGEGSKAVKPFYGYIKYFKALFHKMLRQYITKGTIFEMGSGAKPQPNFWPCI